MKENIFIKQSKYGKDLLKRFNMKNSRSKRTPMSTTTMLDKDEHDKSVNQKLDRDIIGSVIYYRYHI